MAVVSRCAAVFAAVLVAAAAFAGDPPPKDMLRDDIAALVTWVPTNDRDLVPDGPSPTVLTARIVAKGDAKVKAELKTLWKLATTERTEASSRIAGVEQTIRFLYGTDDAKELAVRLVEGAVVAFVPARGDYDFGSFDRPVAGAGGSEKKTYLAFDALVKGGKLRTAPKPQAVKILDALLKGDVASWVPAAQQALARAVGETAAGPLAAKLVDAATQQPTDPLLSTALAWSGAPQAETELRGRVASLAARVAEGKTAAAPLLAAAAAGLAHVKAEALSEELDKLSPEARTAALRAAGTALVMRHVLDRAEKAGDDERIAAFESVRAAIGDGNGEVPASEGSRLVRYLHAAAADAGLRAAALETAETLLYAYNRYPITDSSTMNGIEEKNTGEKLGPYPDIAVVLGHLAEDLASGAAVFHDARTSIWDEASARTGDGGGAQSSVRSPHPNTADSSAKSPVALAGELAADGIRLTLTNKSGAPLALNAVSLRWGCGSFVRTRLQATGGKATEFTSLKLELGFVRAPVAVPAEKLLVLAAGASHTWTVPVREEHRNVDHIAVSMMSMTDVVGKPAAPLVGGFWDTWVK